MTTDATNTDVNENDGKVVVIDNGSGLMKAGFGGNDAPTAVFPSVVGRPRHKGVMVGMNQVDVFIGHESVAKRGILSQKYPIEHGIVTNWDDMEHIWHHTYYNELRIAPEDHTVLLSEIVLNPKANREKMTQIMFEYFNVPSYYVANQAALTLYALGKVTGTVVQSGHNVTNIVPCYEGIPLPHAIQRMEFGGKDVTEYLRKLLNERGYDISRTVQEMEIVDDIKQRLAFVPRDYEKELETAEISIDNAYEQTYELPDGQSLIVGTELFRCTQVLFKPQLIGLEQNGIHLAVCDSIKKCDAEIQNELFDNIVFGGGNTMFKGIEERLFKEINDLVSKKILVDGYLRRYYLNHVTKPLYKDIKDLMNKYASFYPNINPSPNRNYSAWIGGSVLSSLSSFLDVCITRADYDEKGPSVVHQQCV